MLMGFEPEDDIESVTDEESGDVLLYRIETRDGRKVRTRVGVRPAGQKPNGSKLECYRCGRLGHISRECRSKTHRDGGPLRTQGARGRSGAGNLEEDETADSPPVPAAAPSEPSAGGTPAAGPVTLGTLDSCSPDEGARDG